MSVLLRDLYGHGCKAPLFSPGSIDSCVKDTEVPSKKRMETGFYCGEKSVSIPMRYMYINQSYFDCSQCCPGNYWSTKYRKCAKCDDCVTNMEPNVWTQCYDFSSCQSTSTSSTTLPTSTKPYAPGIPTTLPVTTPVQILAPVIAPGEPQIKSENVTLMIFQWKPVKGTKKSPIDYYEVEYGIKGSLLAQSLNTTIAEIGIKNLKLCQDYEVKVRAGNLKGVGPWSDILQFQSPGENPKRKPQNVKLSRQERIVTISWDKITASHDSFEEPVLGFRIEYWPLGKTTNKRVITTNLNFINITVEDKGYNISVNIYNRCGAGPPVYKETNPSQVIRANEHSKGWIVAVVFIVLMVLGGGGVLFVIFKLRRKRNRRRQNHSTTYTPVSTGEEKANYK